MAYAQSVPSHGNTLDGAAVVATVKRVAEWQLAHPVSRDPRHWSLAPLYDGMIDASLVTGDPLYLAAVVHEGLHIGFELGSRTYHADGHAAGHAWLRLYLMDPQAGLVCLSPFIERFDKIVNMPIVQDLSFRDQPPLGLRRTDRWTWADALYMSPPTMSLLAQATGDDRYLGFIDKEFSFAYNNLFDPAEQLFYRDETYIGQTTPNGQKVFWARGNAWVYAGLALLLSSMRPDYPTRLFYLSLFHQMSLALLVAQQPDGLWYMSLKDPAHVPLGETSSSALFLAGMAWGVREGVLDAATYWPAVERGWNAILTRIDEDGAVSFVQPFGEAPVNFDPKSRETYGTGAVLMAGAEIARTLSATAQVEPAALLERAERLAPRAPLLSDECESNDCDTD
ncbi:MAG TPA: glycoside hydrolase family 88 protein [Gammaproteobacteria bacterium]